MLSLIAFGVIALIVVALLLTFNMRSFGRTETTQTVQPEAKVATKEPDADIEHQVLDKNQEDFIPEKKDQTLTLSDQEYRNILRQYHTKDKPEYSVSPAKDHSDKDYRTALRSMRPPK
ncbi:hypothetical protein REC12_20230 [Desulfosporosinus sp. PR]|uniref:hypothetical protein n=1 Tax=Candidatus Desulfosporosinus nitrosoreducens TaxID=3401928 RepID=UPI0027E977BB|nr:hypothetical protein [Desulfosporosinus sp. PR]MDQ7095926.1 hypothetical protein [Desulfosporosinus sp. PR]